MRGPFQPYMPRGDSETFRFAESITTLLNRPYRNEFCVAVPCEEALLTGRSLFGLAPAGLTGFQAAVRTAGAVDCTALVGASIGTNSIKVVPFIWNNAFPIITIGCQTTAGVATSKARVGIYDCVDDLGGDFGPNNLIVGSDEFDCSASGEKTTANLTTQLEPGHVYYAAFLAYTAAATVYTIPVAGVNTILESNTGVPVTHMSVAYTLASSSVGLPAVYPTGATAQSTAPPAVFLTPQRSSGPVSTIVRSGASPYLKGTVIRRVRLTKNEPLPKVSANPSVKIRALMSNSRGAVEVGVFDNMLGGLDANNPRLISSNADINIDVPAGSVLQAEITQRGWPKTPIRDATVLFDLALS